MIPYKYLEMASEYATRIEKANYLDGRNERKHEETCKKNRAKRKKRKK